MQKFLKIADWFLSGVVLMLLIWVLFSAVPALIFAPSTPLMFVGIIFAALALIMGGLTVSRLYQRYFV